MWLVSGIDEEHRFLDWVAAAAFYRQIVEDWVAANGDTDHRAEVLVSPAGSPPHISTAQLPAGRTGEPPEYVHTRDDSPAHPAETWIRRYTHRTSGGGR